MAPGTSLQVPVLSGSALASGTALGVLGAVVVLRGWMCLAESWRGAGWDGWWHPKPCKQSSWLVLGCDPLPSAKTEHNP